jgi:hypothetical protein
MNEEKNQKKNSQATEQDTSREKPQLNDEQLNKVAGGVTFGDIKGESTDNDHKDWVEIL